MSPRLRSFDDELAPARAPTAAARAHALHKTQLLLARADQTYRRFSCPASAECCQLAKTQRQPWLWPTEWELLRRSDVAPHPRTDGACPFLDQDGRRCRVYADRPFGCRTFFCERASGGRHPLEETTALSLELERVAKELDPDAEPRPLLDWIAG